MIASPNSKEQDRRILELKSFIELLFCDGTVVELRCIHKYLKALSGLFTNFEAMAAHALAAEEEGYDCYFGLAPRKRKRFENNDLYRGAASKSEDVLRRQWLLIDIDPVKKNPKKPATKREIDKAKSVFAKTVTYLRSEMGWPLPIAASSGNGFHALFQIDLPINDNGIVKRCLEALDQKFSTAKAKVDTSVHDAARISRLIGTKNFKGRRSAGEAPRFSKLLGRPKVIKQVSKGHLTKLANLAKTTISANKSVKPPGMTHAPKQLGAKFFCLEFNRGRKDKDQIGKEDVLKSAEEWCMQQPLAESGKGGHNQTFTVATGLVLGFQLTPQEAKPIISKYNAKLTEKWTDGELDHKISQAAKIAKKKPHEIGVLAKKHFDAEKVEGSTKQELLAIIREQEFWHDKKNQPYLSVTIKGKQRNLKPNSNDLRVWLCYEFSKRKSYIPSKSAIDDVLRVCEGLAVYEGQQYETFNRVGKCDGKTYIDLSNSSGDVVEITPNGWSIIRHSPVKFLRPSGFEELPRPLRKGSIAELRPFLNLATDQDFVLVVAWLLMAFHPGGEYPVLVLNGQQGSAKSTTTNFLKRLTDPNEAAVLSGPKSQDDFCVLANNNRVLVFDNLSHINGWLSDSLCRAATGGANKKRTLYTDCDETILRFCNPVILNGIGDIVTRADLLDRCISIDVPLIEKRIASSRLNEQFESAYPRILGAIFDATSWALANPVVPDDLPRMATFAKWMASAEPEFARQWNSEPQDFIWEQGSFLEIYRDNILKSSSTALDQHAIVPELQDLIRKTGFWEGSATELLEALQRSASHSRRTSRDWPKGAISLGRLLIRLAPSFSKIGIDVRQRRSSDSHRTRLWTITQAPTVLSGGSGLESVDESRYEQNSPPIIPIPKPKFQLPKKPLDGEVIDLLKEMDL